MEDLEKYDLTEEEYQRCLASAEMAIFMDVMGCEHPKSIFVVAQPGAGKTGLRGFVASEAYNSGEVSRFVEFNPDEIALHHKNYREIMKAHPEKSFVILQKFTGRALDTYLRKKAVEIRCNILQETTFRSTDEFIKIIDFQKNGGTMADSGKFVPGGYSVEINALALDRFRSLLSCFEREQYFIENGLPPRAVSRQYHDSAYYKMLETIDIIEDRKLCDKIRVFKRGPVQDRPELIYPTDTDRFLKASDVIKSERQRQEIDLLKNPKEFEDKIEALKTRCQSNKSLTERVEDLQKAFEERLDEFNHER